MKETQRIMLLIFAMFLWGSMLTLSQPLLLQIYPFTLTTLEFLIALLILAPIAYKQGFHRKLLQNRNHVLYGLMGIVLFFSLQHLGLKFSSVHHALFLQSLIPVTIALLYWMILKQRFSRFYWFGMATALIGVTLITLRNGHTNFFSNWIGDLLILLSVIAFAFYTILGRQHMRRYPASVSHFIAIILGLLFLLPSAIIECSIKGWPTISLRNWFSLIFLGILIAGITLWLWQMSVNVIPPERVAFYLYLIPCFSLLFTFVRGGTITPLQWSGVFLIILGFLISEKRITWNRKRVKG